MQCDIKINVIKFQITFQLAPVHSDLVCDHRYIDQKMETPTNDDLSPLLAVGGRFIGVSDYAITQKKIFQLRHYAKKIIFVFFVSLCNNDRYI